MRYIFNNYQRRNENGFTIVEMVVVMTVLAILAPLLFVIMNDLYTSNTTSLGLNTQDTNVKTVLRSIDSDLSNATGWDTTLAVDRPLGPKNSTTTSETWSYCGTGGTINCIQSVNRVLIAYINATDKSAADNSRLPVFANTGGSCDTSLSNIDIVKVAYIYFVAADPSGNYNDLYRRTIVNPEKDVFCNGATPYQVTTCALSVRTNANCKDLSGKSHTDAVLLTNVTSFNVDYYATPNGSAISDPYKASAGSITSSQSIGVTVTSQVRIDGKLSTNTSDIRITRPN